MSEPHYLITRRGDAFVLEASHGADRIELAMFWTVGDARDAARGVRAWTQLDIVDRSGVE